MALLRAPGLEVVFLYRLQRHRAGCRDAGDQCVFSLSLVLFGVVNTLLVCGGHAMAIGRTRFSRYRQPCQMVYNNSYEHPLSH